MLAKTEIAFFIIFTPIQLTGFFFFLLFDKHSTYEQPVNINKDKFTQYNIQTFNITFYTMQLSDNCKNPFQSVKITIYCYLQ